MFFPCVFTDYSIRQDDGPYLDLLKNWKIGILGQIKRLTQLRPHKSGGLGSDLSIGRHGRLQGIGKGLNMGRDFGQYWVVGSPQKCRYPESLQMENHDLGWIGLGLGNPKTIFSVKKHRFLTDVWQFSIIWGFPLGGPPRYFYLGGPSMARSLLSLSLIHI